MDSGAKRGAGWLKDVPWLSLFNLTFLQMCVSGVINSSSVLSAYIIDDMHFTKAQIGLIGSAACVGQALLSVLFGVLLDRKGRRFWVVICCTCICICIMIASLANTFLFYMSMLILVGCWCAFSTPYGAKEVSACSPRHVSSFSLSVRQTGVPLGTLMMTLILPSIAKRAGWQAAIRCAGAIVLAYGAIHYLTHAFKKDKADRVSASQAERNGGPAVTRRFLTNKNYWFIVLSGTVFMGMQYVLLTYMPLFLSETCGLSVEAAASCLVISQIGGSLARVFLGIISDRFFKSTSRALLILESGIMIGVMLLMQAFTLHTPMWLCCIAAALFGASAMGWNGLHTAAISHIVVPENRGLGTGVMMATIQVGTLSVPFIVGKLVDIGLGYKKGFLFCCLLIAIAILLLSFADEQVIGEHSVGQAAKEAL